MGEEDEEDEEKALQDDSGVSIYLTWHHDASIECQVQ